MFRPLDATIRFFFYLNELYEWLYKVRNCLSVVRSHHPLRVGLIFYGTKRGISCQLGAAQRA